MSPRRKAWLLVAVLMLGVVFAVLLDGPRLWIEFAYEKRFLDHKSGVRTFYLKKRFEWLPGESVVVPDQMCDRCLQDMHARCREHFPPPSGMVNVFNPRQGSVGWTVDPSNATLADDLVLANFACTCFLDDHDLTLGENGGSRR